MPDIAWAALSASQVARIRGAELPTPQANCFVEAGEATLGEQVFDISEAEGESVVHPHGVANDHRPAPVTSIQALHRTMVTDKQEQYPLDPAPFTARRAPMPSPVRWASCRSPPPLPALLAAEFSPGLVREERAVENVARVQAAHDVVVGHGLTSDDLRGYSLVGRIRKIVRPSLHQDPTSIEQVRARIRGLDLALHGVRQTRLGNLARLARLPAPIAE